MTAVERKYQLTRIREGDYIVPSNSGETLWRITKAVGVEREDEGWHAYRYRLSIADLHARYGDALPDEFIDWSEWDHWSGGFRTRRGAIEDVVGR